MRAVQFTTGRLALGKYDNLEKPRLNLSFEQYLILKYKNYLILFLSVKTKAKSHSS